MDNHNITIEEYIRLEEEKARRRGKVYNWKTATYAALSCEPTVSSLNNNEIEFIISFDESDDEDCMIIFDKNSFSYKIISVNDLKTDLENDDDKVNMPLFPSPKPTKEDLETLWKLVRARFKSTKPVEDLDLMLCSDLKTMFEPETADAVWRNQLGGTVTHFSHCGHVTCGTVLGVRVGSMTQCKLRRNSDVCLAETTMCQQKDSDISWGDDYIRASGTKGRWGDCAVEAESGALFGVILCTDYDIDRGWTDVCMYDQCRCRRENWNPLGDAGHVLFSRVLSMESVTPGQGLNRWSDRELKGEVWEVGGTGGLPVDDRDVAMR
ncbi:hypothetical protein Tco_1274057 [Tanacetum coccineum]